MKTFTSTVNGKPITWELGFSVALFRRIKALLGLDLMEPTKPLSATDERQTVFVLHCDLATFVDAAFVSVQKQAEAIGVTDEDFGESLDDAAFVACRKAFFEEWADFFERLGVTAQAAGLRKTLEIYQKAGSRIDNVPAEALMTEVDKALDQWTAGLSSTNSPDSSASIPNRSL